jgi:hypothetical protein
MITLSFLLGIGLCGVLFMLLELRDAPEGFQDESGFHFVWQNNRPEVPNISCIWTARADKPSLAGGGGGRRAA